MIALTGQGMAGQAESVTKCKPAASANAERTAKAEARPEATRPRPERPERPEAAEKPERPERPEPRSKARIYDIPLTEELQEYTFELCERYSVDYEMVLALMEKESGYRADAISKTNDYGIMQINQINHAWLEKELGITDFLNPEQNILCGVYVLSRLQKKYEDLTRTLLAYNMGEAGARRYIEKGNADSAYTRDILSRREMLLEAAGKEEVDSQHHPK